MPQGQPANIQNGTSAHRTRDSETMAAYRGVYDTSTGRAEYIHPGIAREGMSRSGSRLSLADIRRPKRIRDRDPAVVRRSAAKPAGPRQKPSTVLHRSSFGAKLARKTVIRTTQRPKRKKLYASAGVIVIVTLLGAGARTWYRNSIDSTQSSVLSKITTSSNYPNEDELPVDAEALYKVAPDLPRLIEIPKIQASGRIQKLGLRADNQLRAPVSVFDAGWYEGSAKPGEKGVMVVNGYTNGYTKRGVFYALANLREGDIINIERGDGAVLHYKVIKQEMYDDDQIKPDSLLQPFDPEKPNLKLVTSSDRFDTRTGRFERKTVVFAVQE